MNEEEILKQEEQNPDAKRASLGIQRAESADYGSTMEALKQAETALPVFKSSYDAEINELYSKIVNRKSFQYSPSADPLYGAYREQYAREGKMAMRSSAGEAADLTGGYGSSYAQTVGRQQYDKYLAKLNDVFPELYSSALQRYESEGQQLSDRFNATTQMQAGEYDRFRDSVGDMQYQQGLATAAEQTSYDRAQQAFTTLMELISKTGYLPSEQELSAAGMPQGQADALRNEYLRKNGGSGGGSYRGGGVSYAPTSRTVAQIKLDACANWGADGRTRR